MAFTLPNFVGQNYTPDYSGIGDAVGNYYAAKQAPMDVLVKQIQAQFAKPDAEAALQQTRLANTKTGLDIQQLRRQMTLQQQLDSALRTALAGGSTAATSSPVTGVNSAPSMAGGMPATSSNLPSSSSSVPIINPKLSAGIANSFQNQAPTGTVQAQQTQPMAQQLSPMAQQPAVSAPVTNAPLQETVISPGSQNLYGVDQLYDNNPAARSYLEGKGFKKTQEIKFDNKTGKTSVITTYPSGKITTQTTGIQASDEGLALTPKMISKHQNVISSVDNALPIIKQIQDLAVDPKTGKASKSWEPFPRSDGLIPGLGLVPGFQSQSTKYEALVNSALDTLVGAYGLPLSNEGLDTVKKQLLIGHGETDAAYLRRLKTLVDDLQRRKAYSQDQVKQSNKIQPISRMDSGQDGYSSNDWEEVQ